MSLFRVSGFARSEIRGWLTSIPLVPIIVKTGAQRPNTLKLLRNCSLDPIFA
jgi:hypothetical protein